MSGTYHPDANDVREMVRARVNGFWVRIDNEGDVEALRDDGLCLTSEPKLGENVYRVEW